MKRLLLLLLALSVSVAFADEEDKWTAGAVKALMTKEEREAYKNLRSDADKQKFVEQFWSKRDPSPGTPENEFKIQIEQKSAQIKKLGFPTRKQDPLDSDMGQTLLLLGQPSEQKNVKEESRGIMAGGDDDDRRNLGTDEEQVQKQVWVYRTLPKEVAPGEVKIEFSSDSGAEWNFVSAKKAEEVLDKARQHQMMTAKQPSQAGRPQQLPTEAPQGQPAQPAPAQPAPAQQPQAAPVTTPEVKAALDAAAKGNPPTDIPVTWLADSFMTSDGTTFATFAIRSVADTTAAKVGLRVQDGAGSIVKETEVPFANGAEEAGYFQHAVILTAPGNYTAVAAVANGGKVGAAKQVLTVPDYGSKLGVSSVILAKKFSQLTEAKPEKEPYTFGKIKVHPSVDRVFNKTDDLIVVYEVYNFQGDAATKPNLEVVFTFQQGTNKPQRTAPAAPNGLVTGKKMTIPTSFPLANFPPGKYKLTIELTDKGSGQTASQETTFEVK